VTDLPERTQSVVLDCLAGGLIWLEEEPDTQPANDVPGPRALVLYEATVAWAENEIARAILGSSVNTHDLSASEMEVAFRGEMALRGAWIP
jgi:hypothetical protein